jgi:hypothetical protein
MIFLLIYGCVNGTAVTRLQITLRGRWRGVPSFGRAPRITVLDPRALEIVAPDTGPCAVAHGPRTGAYG